jgi:hypothetical protein
VIDPNSLHRISSLPKKHDRSGNLKDDYLWYPGCRVNIKFRGEGLRIKRQISETSDGSIKRWITEVYSFPISLELFNMILLEFKIMSPQIEKEAEKEIQNRQQLLSILRFASEAFQVITVDKHREQYSWPNSHRDTQAKEVTIEIATINSPKPLTSISIEHQDLERVNNILKHLQLPSKLMNVLSYLDCLRFWACGKKLGRV